MNVNDIETKVVEESCPNEDVSVELALASALNPVPGGMSAVEVHHLGDVVLNGLLLMHHWVTTRVEGFERSKLKFPDSSSFYERHIEHYKSLFGPWAIIDRFIDRVQAEEKKDESVQETPQGKTPNILAEK